MYICIVSGLGKSYYVLMVADGALRYQFNSMRFNTLSDCRSYFRSHHLNGLVAFRYNTYSGFDDGEFSVC